MEGEFKFSNEIEVEEFLSQSNEVVSSLNAAKTRNDDEMDYEESNCSTKDWNSLIWLCYHCGKGFNAYASLKDHKESFHRELCEEEELFICFDCEETLLGYSLFLNHIRSRHYDSLKLCCDACNDVLPDLKQLAEHREEHMEFSDEIHPNVFHCTLCEKVFSTEILFKLHIKDYHNNIRFDGDNSKDAGIKSVMQYDEKRKYSLRHGIHLSESIDDTDEESLSMEEIKFEDEYGETEGVFQCGICVQSFKSESSLKVHMESHNRKQSLQCGICSKTFKYRSDLKMHMPVHSDERPFKCDICSKSYKYSKYFKHHLNNHSDKALHKCIICPKKFKPKKNLKKEMDTQRLKRRNYDTDNLKTTISSYKNKICFQNTNGVPKIVSKLNPIWEQISKDINFVKTPAALYTYVQCNRDGIRTLMENESPWNVTAQSEDSIVEKGKINKFQIRMPFAEFDEMTKEMDTKRLKRRNYDTENLKTTISSYKNKICFQNTNGVPKIVSKLNPIWEQISKDINFVKTPAALYTYVQCNRDGIRTLMENELPWNVTAQSEDSIVEKGKINKFQIRMPFAEFDEMLMEKVRLCKTRYKTKSRTYQKTFVTFKTGSWHNFFLKEIWNLTKIGCGFYLKNHYISSNKKCGRFMAYCRCGSKLEGNIYEETNDIIAIECTLQKNENGPACGKIYLRKPVREALTTELSNQSVFQYRNNLANKLMEKHDPEPAILPKASALYRVNTDNRQSKHLSKDPITALQILHAGLMQNIIHAINLEPFSCQYSTNHQHTVYRTLSKLDGTILAIDATGSLFKSIQKINTKTAPMFLYLCVAYNKEVGQVCVNQMITEKHTTLNIYAWLIQWIDGIGLPCPKEVVSDSSKALLSAAVRAFTQYRTINDYADACMNNDMPPTFIRIDGAHFIHSYASFMSKEKKKIKMFYMAVIGRLILSQDIVKTENILRAVMMLAGSECDGYEEIEKNKIFLNEILKTGGELNLEGLIENLPQSESHEFIEESNGNKWQTWAKEIYNDVLKQIPLEETYGINPYWFPELNARIISDFKWYPLWSCICVPKFGYGRCPASSAYVEAEFKNLKTQTLNANSVPMRVDEFVEQHVQSIEGHIKLMQSALKNTTNDVENPTSPTCFNGDIHEGVDNNAISILENSQSGNNQFLTVSACDVENTNSACHSLRQA